MGNRSSEDTTTLLLTPRPSPDIEWNIDDGGDEEVDVDGI